MKTNEHNMHFDRRRAINSLLIKHCGEDNAIRSHSLEQTKMRVYSDWISAYSFFFFFFYFIPCFSGFITMIEYILRAASVGANSNVLDIVH